MTKQSTIDFFNKEASETYDERISKLAPIGENMHFLIRILLKDLPPDSQILCAGAGTGAEILSLAKTYPGFTFVGVDPSESMLEICKKRLQEAGVINRCKLIHGYVNDLPAGENFNAALSILVAHFVEHKDRLSFFKNMTSRLRAGGILINTEISCDLKSSDFSLMLNDWEKIQTMMGATPESLKNLPQQLTEVFTVLPPAETEELLRQSGLQSPIHFFQTFMIHGWHAKK